MSGSDSTAAAAKLIEAFRALDGKRVGYIPTATMKLLLERYSDFSTTEREEFLAEADQGGQVHYEQFVKEIVLGDAK